MACALLFVNFALAIRATVLSFVSIDRLPTLPYVQGLRVEQAVQIGVPAALAVCVFHPRTRALVEPRSARGPMFGGH